MKKYTLALLSIFLLSNSCSGQVTDTSAILGTLFKCWRAVSHEYSPIYGLEEDEIKTYSKQKVCFNRDTVTMYNGSLYDPRYSVKKVNAENFARDNFDCGKTQIGIVKDSVYEIKILSMIMSPENGTVHKMTDIIAFDGACIYVVKDGVIFKLFDSEAKTGGRSSN